MQRVEEATPFTLVDFVACDARYARHFARIPNIPRAQGSQSQSQSQSQVPLASILPRTSRGQLDSVPYLMLADDSNVLQRVLVAETLVREARRCKAMWNGLQELAGIHNSHVEKALAAEREANKVNDVQISLAPAPAITAPVAVAATAEPVASEAEKVIRRGLHRNATLRLVQRVHPDQRQAVRLRRQQAGLHRRRPRRHLRPTG